MEHTIPELKYLRTVIISEHKILRLFQKNEKYFIEIISNGYKVKFLAGKTLKVAEKNYKDIIKKIKEGRSTLELSLVYKRKSKEEARIAKEWKQCKNCGMRTWRERCPRCGSLLRENKVKQYVFTMKM